MDWQLGLVLICVAAAALFLGWSAWRGVARARSGCGGCGCKANDALDAGSNGRTEKTSLIPSESIADRLSGRPANGSASSLLK